jgi:hypothetical protein
MKTYNLFFSWMFKRWLVQSIVASYNSIVQLKLGLSTEAFRIRDGNHDVVMTLGQCNCT